MKKTIIYTIAIILSFTFCYLAVVFVTLEFDFREWKESLRFLILCMSIMISYMAIVILQINSKN